MEENGRLVQFLYNEDREVVAEKDCSGNIIRYIRGLGLISSDSENAKTYYHYVSDEQGACFRIIRRFFMEAAEGHGVRFAAMVDTFAVIQPPQNGE